MSDSDPEFDEQVLLGAEAFGDMFANIEREAAFGLIQALSDYRGQPAPPEISWARETFEANLPLTIWGDELLGRMAALDLDLSSISDTDLLLTATSAWAYPHYDQDEPEPLECVDWMPVVAFLVAEGPGAEVAVDRLAAMALTKHRDESPPSPGSAAFAALEKEFAPHLRVWDLVGVTSHGQLSELGQWLLPRSFCRSWGVDFD